MYKPFDITETQDVPPAEWRIPQIDGGVCYDDLEFKLRDNQSPYMLNEWYKEKVLTKRPGQAYMPGTSLSATAILQSINYNGDIIFHSGTKLYKKVISTGTETELLSGLPETKGSFVIFNNILLYINGMLTKYDGTTASEVTPFIPVVVINRTPTGGGDVNQNYNRYGAVFTTWFNGDGTAVDYTLPQSALDATTLTVKVDGVTKTEGTHFTVNRVTGIVTFSTAPATGQNNVVITAEFELIPNNDQSKNPDTGDNSNDFVLMILTSLSLLLAFFVRSKKTD
jgi:LPXTG-motif cell wall-anchored protein